METKRQKQKLRTACYFNNNNYYCIVYFFINVITISFTVVIIVVFVYKMIVWLFVLAFLKKKNKTKQRAAANWNSILPNISFPHVIFVMFEWSRRPLVPLMWKIVGVKTWAPGWYSCHVNVGVDVSASSLSLSRGVSGVLSVKSRRWPLLSTP